MLVSANAQDAHFSQFQSAPMHLNPAMAGANYELRTSLAHRNQWGSVAEPFQSSMLSVDGRLFEKKLERNGNLGVGLTFLNDRAGRTDLIKNAVTLNVAYHALIAEDQTFGGGLYAGWGQQTLNQSGSTWGSQYIGGEFDATASSGEALASASFSTVDFGGGLLYTYGSNSRRRNKSDLKVNAGAAVFHVNRPNYSFIANSSEKQYIRYTGFVNAELPTSVGYVSWMPAIYFQSQGAANQVLLGTYAKFKLSSASIYTGYNKASYFSAGLFYRHQDAMVAKAQFSWASLNVGFSYDINISTLSNVSRNRGGFELFLSFAAESLSSGFGRART